MTSIYILISRSRYTHAALALKAASPKLQVGGPATCCVDCWIDDFVNHMDNNSIPYDFISTHAYSSCQVRLRKETPFFAPFCTIQTIIILYYTKHHHYTKTGSGQAY